MKTRSYSVSELKSIIRESANEFNAILGSAVISNNKKNNEKAYKEIEKNVKNYDGGLKPTESTKKIKPENGDNKGMQDLSYEKGSVSDDFKKKVSSQAKGYTSSEAEKKHKNEPFGNAEFGIDIKAIKDKAKKEKEAKVKAKQIGLVGREIKDEIADNAKEKAFESKKIKKLYFKNTNFISESHLTSRIPDEFRVEGNRFLVKDNKNNEFLVEWTCNKANIIQKTNKKELNEELQRIKDLFNYKQDNIKKFNRHIDEDKEYQQFFNLSKLL